MERLLRLKLTETELGVSLYIETPATSRVCTPSIKYYLNIEENLMMHKKRGDNSLCRTGTVILVDRGDQTHHELSASPSPPPDAGLDTIDRSRVAFNG